MHWVFLLSHFSEVAWIFYCDAFSSKMKSLDIWRLFFIIFFDTDIFAQFYSTSIGVFWSPCEVATMLGNGALIPITARIAASGKTWLGLTCPTISTKLFWIFAASSISLSFGFCNWLKCGGGVPLSRSFCTFFNWSISWALVWSNSRPSGGFESSILTSPEPEI